MATWPRHIALVPVIIRAVTFFCSRHFGRESPAVSAKHCPVCGQQPTCDVSVTVVGPVITDNLPNTKTQFSPSCLNTQTESLGNFLYFTALPTLNVPFYTSQRYTGVLEYLSRLSWALEGNKLPR